MTKIVVNRCYGGFGLSHEAYMRYADKKGLKVYPEPRPWGGIIYWTVPEADRLAVSEPPYTSVSLYDCDLERDDPILVEVVEELCVKANGSHAALEVVTVPDGIHWSLEEYDGQEWIAEAHETW